MKINEKFKTHAIFRLNEDNSRKTSLEISAKVLTLARQTAYCTTLFIPGACPVRYAGSATLIRKELQIFR
jgi:hypothetical protein